MKLVFGRKYASRFKTQEEVKDTKRLWANAFVFEKITARHVDAAFQKMIETRLDWPPELSEFLTLCDDPTALGIPSIDDVLTEIINRHGKYRYHAEYQFSSNFVAIINGRCGKKCLQEVASTFEKRLKKEYQKAIFELKTGVLPIFKAALPPPDQPHKSKGYVAKNVDKQIERFNELRKQVAQK